MTRSELNVLISGKRAGTLFQDDSGSLSFRYAREYRGAPLSSAMPLSTRTYQNKTVLPYLWGLLPEDVTTRNHIATEAGISPNNPFDLLGVIGLDCPGAVQFSQPGYDAEREERLVAVSEEEIADRLSKGRQGNTGWVAKNEHWSLGGQQSKFALRRQGNRWFSCEGAAATTHIFKSGVQGLAYQALNEYVCMRLAAACGIDTADVEYLEFEGERGVEPAIVITRYDRVSTKDGVVRLHQEDFCQALGCLPENKYTMFGGPTSANILNSLLKTGLNAQNNAASFLQMLFFNYLLAATDAHAKNYSLMLNENGDHKLAPLYDAASIAPYVEARQLVAKPPKLAMPIGGENRAGRVTRKNLSRFVDQCSLTEVGITAEGCADLITFYADIIPSKLSELFDQLECTSTAPSARELRARMEAAVTQLCATAKAHIIL